MLSGGCYHSEEVNAFLRKPRSPVSGMEYRVYPPDTIMISSQRVPEISSVLQRISPDGKINLPLLKEIFVAGMTPAEIEKAVVAAALTYYEEADATVTVSAYESQKYYIYGQASGGGAQPWTGRDTLLDALARCPPTNLGWPERIIVVRGGEPQVGGPTTMPAETKKYRMTGVHPETPDSPRHKMTINLMAMVREGDLSNNILLMPNDIIYVQPNPFAEIGLKLQAVLFPVGPVLETARVPQTVSKAGQP
jgi:polysaccharide biosynthesis/export protein